MNNMNNKMVKEFLKVINDGYHSMLSSEHGNRSNKKLIPIHQFIAEQVKEKLGNDFDIFSINQDKSKSKEKTVEGKYYDKNIDIAITYKNKDIGGISVKFITGNYQQNANNYFEHLLGETANLKRNNYSYSSIYIVPKYLPYYKNNKILSRIEEINSNNLLKYLKISKEDKELCHVPDMFFIFMVDTGTKDFLQKNIGQKVANNDIQYAISSYDFQNDTTFNQNIKDFLLKHSNIQEFFEAFTNLIKSKTYGL